MVLLVCNKINSNYISWKKFCNLVEKSQFSQKLHMGYKRPVVFAYIWCTTTFEVLKSISPPQISQTVSHGLHLGPINHRWGGVQKIQMGLAHIYIISRPFNHPMSPNCFWSASFFFFFPFLNFIPKVKYSNPSWISVKPTGSIKFPGDWVTWVGLCGYIDHRGPHRLSCMVQDIPEEQWPSIIPRGPRSIQPRQPLPLPP